MGEFPLPTAWGLVYWGMTRRRTFMSYSESDYIENRPRTKAGKAVLAGIMEQGIPEAILADRNKRLMQEVIHPERVKSDAPPGDKFRHLRIAHEKSRDMRYPLERVNRVARLYGYACCDFYLDPPRYLDVFVKDDDGRVVEDRFGRIIHMDKPSRVKKRVTPEDFGILVRFETVFPPHPNPFAATEKEKEDRLAYFLNMYASSGLATPSAEAVGVPYYLLIVWLNEGGEVWSKRFEVARASARLVIEDTGRQKALMGDPSMIAFFMKHDNPELYLAAKKKKDSADGALPDGVDADSVVEALKIIEEAGRGMPPLPPSGALPVSGAAWAGPASRAAVQWEVR